MAKHWRSLDARVLLVEDEPLIALDGEATLLSLGVGRIAIAHNVEQAQRIIDEGAVDAAILDLRLGADSSVVLAERLETMGVPFGFLTGYVGDSLPDRFKCRPYVAKPFSTGELTRLLNALLPPPGA